MVLRSSVRNNKIINIQSTNTSKGPINTADKINNKNNSNNTKNLTISSPYINNTLNLDQDSDDQHFIPYKTKRNSSPGQSRKTKEPKTANKTNSSITSPNRFDVLSVTENDKNKILHESTSEKPPSIPSPIFISTPVNYNDFVKSILAITGENAFECKSTSKYLKLSTTSIYS
jgi:hypothetical protein